MLDSPLLKCCGLNSVIIDKHISIWRLLKIIWLRLLIMLLIAVVGALVVLEVGEDYIFFSAVVPSILGTALSIFLGFRTNSAFDRWMKARGYWSDILSASENFSLALARVDGEAYLNRETGKSSIIAEKTMTRMIRRTIAWAWCLNFQLKDMPPLKGLEKYLDPQEYTILKTFENPALKMLYNQSRDFRIAMRENQFTDGEHFEIVTMLRDMLKAQNSCEGLRTTPFPTHYTFFTDVFIWMLVVLMAFSLPSVDSIGYFSIFAVVLTGWVFSMINGIGSYMEEPFVDNRNVIPMDALSRKLERSLLQIALEDKHIPPEITPKDGALY